MLCTVWEWIRLCPSRQIIIHETNEIRWDFKCLWNMAQGGTWRVLLSFIRGFAHHHPCSHLKSHLFSGLRPQARRLPLPDWNHQVFCINPQPKWLCRRLTIPKLKKRLLVLCTVWEWIRIVYFCLGEFSWRLVRWCVHEPLPFQDSPSIPTVPTFPFTSKTRQGAVAKGVGLSYSKNARYCQHVKDIPWVGEQLTIDVVKVKQEIFQVRW